MQNNDKKYFIPVDGAPIEVSEEIYRAYYQPIWNTRYHAQKNGECRCTKAQLSSTTWSRSISGTATSNPETSWISGTAPLGPRNGGKKQKNP